MFDQAAGLRKRVNGIKNSRVIAVASGKGGVGKTNVAVNLGLALRKRNLRVLLIDADLGTANIDVLLGLTPNFHLGHFLSGERELNEIIIDGPGGLNILPGTSGLEEFLDISRRQVERLRFLSFQLESSYDIILVDISAGVHSNNINFISICDEVIVVLVPEPTAIMDAYSLVKILHNHQYSGKINLLINQLNSRQEGKGILERMSKVIRDYLGIQAEIVGYIPFDNHLRQAVKKQKALLDLYPGSKAGQAFDEVAEVLVNKQAENTVDRDNDKEGFINRLLNLFK
ncbi:MAG: MinD/ParA family protein [Halanaerobiaceae bacterium]|nr:MinD/ParA family protein [Halanaerobiaceae bacterium]